MKRIPVSPFPLSAEDQEKFAAHVADIEAHIRSERPPTVDVTFRGDSAEVVEAIRYHYNQAGRWCVMPMVRVDGGLRLLFQ